MRLKQMQERLAKVEQEMAATEAAINIAEESLSRFVSVEETQRTTDKLAADRSKLEALETEWAEISESLEGTE